MVAGKKGFVLSSRPKAYQTLPQHETFKKALEHCGIRKGVSRDELVHRMKTCLPAYHKAIKGEGEMPSPIGLPGEENGG